MTFSPATIQSLHGLALETAKRAGVHVQSRVGNHRGAQTKEGGDTLASQVVTEVDLESQNLILSSLTDSLSAYDLGWLTEESEDNASRHEKEAFWCIDPIDGTLPFTEGVPGYSVSIALVGRSGTPLIGVIHDPVHSTTYHAYQGGGAMRDGALLSAVGAGSSAHHLTWVMDRSMKKSIEYSRAQESLEELARQHGLGGVTILDHAGAVLNACLVMQHKPAVYFKFPKSTRGGGSVWDYAATACLFAQWGQPPTDLFGAPLQLNPKGSTFMNEKAVVYASSGELQEAVLSLYREIRA
ncbi:MAG: inositol monophosphatase family protein [Verrucomicrobiota bacterium]